MNPLIVSWGGGRNSTALLVGMQQRGIMPDLILFADTGGEKPETYDFIAIFDAWLKSKGMPPITTVKSSNASGTLEQEVLDANTLPSIAFGFKTCSQKWKLAPQEKFINVWEPAREAWQRGEKVRQAVGIHADESHRVPRALASTPEGTQQTLFGEVVEIPVSEKMQRQIKKFDYWYPLIDWDWGQAECEAAIRESGLPMPPKSSCFFCPSTKKHEILALKAEHPDLLERALRMESNAADKLVAVKGLGRSMNWREFIARVESEESFLMADPVSVPCMCHDGSD